MAIVVMMAGSAMLGEWSGIMAFAIALLMVFELDLHTEKDADDE